MVESVQYLQNPILPASKIALAKMAGACGQAWLFEKAQLQNGGFQLANKASAGDRFISFSLTLHRFFT